MAAEHVRAERRGALGSIVLDRPEALNALTHPMVRAIGEALDAFEADAAVQTVLITGAGERALCAGGDVVGLRDDVLATGGDAAVAFWRDEYAMNARIAAFPKPVVAIQHGIVLGGGVGVSAHASHRVVTGSTRIGFPEVTIGFVPDVGASWLLTRGDLRLGLRAALTGDHAGAADAIALGLSDAFVPEERLDALAAALETMPADEAIAAHAAEAPEGRWAAEPAAVLAAFEAPDSAAILAELDAAGDAGAAIADTIRSRCPFSVALALASLRLGATQPSLEAALTQELRLAVHAARRPDFAEGVRAQLVDKDRAPRWSPAALAEVDPAEVAAAFAPIPEPDLTFPPPPRASGGHEVVGRGARGNIL